MNTIEIFTRSYVDEKGHWNLSRDTIDSVIKLFNLDVNNCISWVILVSNYDELNTPKKFDLFDLTKLIDLERYRTMEKLHFIFVKDKLSCSEARVEIYRNIIEYYTQFKSMTRLCTSQPDFFMNLDSDDELINYNALIALTNYAPHIKDDLIGFGLEFNGGEPFSDEWTWNIDKFNYSRRYITTETQTMFLFLHSYNIIEYAMQMRRFFKSGPVGDPNESCDDTLMAIEVSYANTLSERFSIGALCANLIRYKIHPNQVSENQEAEFKKWLKDKLHEYGYLYVNSENYYIEEFGKIKKFIPVKPR